MSLTTMPYQLVHIGRTNWKGLWFLEIMYSIEKVNIMKATVRDLKRCETFLSERGWVYDEIAYRDGAWINGELLTFKIDFDDECMVAVGGEGEVAYIPINYYALVGFLIEHSQIDNNYEPLR